MMKSLLIKIFIIANKLVGSTPASNVDYKTLEIKMYLLIVYLISNNIVHYPVISEEACNYVGLSMLIKNKQVFDYTCSKIK